MYTHGVTKGRDGLRSCDQEGQFFPWEAGVKLSSPLADLQARRLMQAEVFWPRIFPGLASPFCPFVSLFRFLFLSPHIHLFNLLPSLVYAHTFGILTLLSILIILNTVLSFSGSQAP